MSTNGPRLSCGAPKKDSFPSVRAPRASCACRAAPHPLCAACKELGLALRSNRCDANRGIVSMGTLAAVPLERRADRVGERPEGQACCHRPAVVSQQHPADPRVALRNPEGKLRPRLDACRKEI